MLREIWRPGIIEFQVMGGSECFTGRGHGNNYQQVSPPRSSFSSAVKQQNWASRMGAGEEVWGVAPGRAGHRAQQDAAPGGTGTDGVNGAHLAPRAQRTECSALTLSSALIPLALTPFPLHVEQWWLLAGLSAQGGLQRAPIPACVPYSNPTDSFHPAPGTHRSHRGGDVERLKPFHSSQQGHRRALRAHGELCPPLIYCGKLQGALSPEQQQEHPL